MLSKYLVRFGLILALCASVLWVPDRASAETKDVAVAHGDKPVLAFLTRDRSATLTLNIVPKGDEPIHSAALHFHGEAGKNPWKLVSKLPGHAAVFEAKGVAPDVMVAGEIHGVIGGRGAFTVRIVDVAVTIDSNRDGDLNDKDEPHERDPVEYDAARGALVLVNCDDDAKRSTASKLVRDFDDSRVNGAKDARDLSDLLIKVPADLAELKVKVAMVNAGEDTDDVRHDLRMLEIGDSATDGLQDKELLGPTAGAESDITHLFKGKIAREYKLEGLEFGELVKLRVWIEHKGKKLVEDQVMLMTTPFLLTPNTQPIVPADSPVPQVIYSDWSSVESGPDNKRFRKQLGGILKHFGVTKSRGQKSRQHEFVQDAMEFGFTRRLSSHAPHEVTLPVALRLNDAFESPEWVRKLVGSDVGFFKAPFRAHKKGDAGGGVEVLPPHGGYPRGRVILSDTGSEELREFFIKQWVQTKKKGPVIVPVSVLGLAHADEVLTVIPTNGGKDFTVFVGSLAIALGAVASLPPTTRWPTSDFKTYGDVTAFYKGVEGAALAKPINTALRKLSGSLGPVKRRLIPVLYNGSSVFDTNMMNAMPVVAGGRAQVYVPRTRIEPFSKRYLWALGRYGYKRRDVRFIDTFELRPKRGEAHCASNVLRVPLPKRD